MNRSKQHFSVLLSAVMSVCLLSACSNQNSNPPKVTNTDPAVTTTRNDAANGSTTTKAATKPVQPAGDLTLKIDTVKAKAGDKRVPVNISNTDNCGVSSGGLTVDFDEGILPIVKDETGLLYYKTTETWTQAISAGTTNLEDGMHRVAYAFFTQDRSDVKENGTLVTIYFDIPEDAKQGTTYNLILKSDQFKNATSAPINVTEENGAIVIE